MEITPQQDGAAPASQQNGREAWKSALITVRSQIADYEREGTSTPGKLKRAARLRASRLALRDVAADYGTHVGNLKASLNDIEHAEKDDDWRRLGGLIRDLLRDLDVFLA